ncbi:MAG: dihydroneopterin triphosphate 2'-epimerase [Pseudomonadales bacterium]|nr:dihydroneopterin triphosphate 2'-epimerase [Pseudomonadales bacterium]
MRTKSSVVSVDEAVIRISNLRLRTYIGFNPEELTKQQDIVINLELAYDASRAGKSDYEEDALNYKLITKKIIHYVEEGRFRLLEKLTHDLLLMIMGDERVGRASIKIDKPHALRFSDSVSVELSACRQSS